MITAVTSILRSFKVIFIFNAFLRNFGAVYDDGEMQEEMNLKKGRLKLFFKTVMNSHTIAIKVGRSTSVFNNF